MILCDTRQQKDDHITKEFDKQKICWVRTKLDTGDYIKICYDTNKCLARNFYTIIDTKKDLMEICGNLAHTSEHQRVVREVELAHNLGCKNFIFLIGDNKIKSTEDLLNWSNPKTKVKGETLAKIMKTFSEHHNCKFIICPKKEMGQKVIQLLSM